MPFTFRPSVGADVVLAAGSSGIANVDFYNEGGSSIVFTRVLGFQHQYVPGGSIVGTAGADTLIGTDQSDIVFWDPSTVTQIINAVDFLTPLSNNAATSIDVLALGGGNDILTLSHDAAQPGNPGLYLQAMTAYGGDGNDILWMAAGNDAVFGDAGTDILAGQAGADILQGGAGTDTLFGGSGTDSLRFDGNDFTQGGADLYQIAVWTGSDANPSFSVSLAGGSGFAWSSDLFFGGSEKDTLQLTNGNDLLLMNTQDLTINGVGQAGNGSQFAEIEVIEGQGGNDIISVNSAASGVAFSGNLSISGGAASDLIVSGTGNDLIVGGNFSGLMAGGDRDTIFGGAGNDTIYGETTIDGQTTTDGGFDTIYGGLGADTVFAGAAGDTVFGDNGQDSLFGGAGDDTLYGGVRVDTLMGDKGTDRLFGDDGEDTFLFSDDYEVVGAGSDDGVTFWTGVGPTNSGTHVFAVNMQGTFDTYDGGASTDEFLGTNGNNLVIANSGDLFVNGVAQPAGAGHLAAIETFIMGGGNDVIVLNGNAGGGQEWTTDVVIFGGTLGDLIVSGAGNDRLAGGNPDAGAAADAFDLDTIYGGSGNDVVFGDRENRETSTEGAADTLYGGDGDDTMFGDAGADRLFGDVGADTLYGGVGDDQLNVNSDQVVDEDILVQGWDGSNAVVEINIVAGTVLTHDRFAGGADFDTVDLRPVSSDGGRVYFGAAAGVSVGTFISGVEMIVTGAAADVINLTDASNDPEVSAYESDITVVAGAANDVVFSGNGSDLIVGDHGAGTLSSSDGDDTLFGGQGNDTIFGDSVTGIQDGAREGADTIFGGSGNDTAFGGAGDDLLVDLSDGATLYGQGGADILSLRLTGVSQTGAAHGGDESAADGDDRVFVYGYYDSSTSSLGAGHDVFIGIATGDNGEGFSGNQIDRVDGGSGNDAISTWDGDDSLAGGSGNDVIWGGAGVDTIYGGDDSDLLYGGAGDGDLLVGGGGVDYYYWARNDGSDTIEDRDNDSIDGDEGENYIFVFAGFSFDAEDPDGFIDGAGVVEIDGNLYDNDDPLTDMVQLTVDDGPDKTIYHLQVLTGEGEGSTLTFDRDEVRLIALGNSDNGTVTVYQWVDDPLDLITGGSYQPV